MRTDSLWPGREILLWDLITEVACHSVFPPTLALQWDSPGSVSPLICVLLRDTNCVSFISVSLLTIYLSPAVICNCLLNERIYEQFLLREGGSGSLLSAIPKAEVVLLRPLPASPLTSSAVLESFCCFKAFWNMAFDPSWEDHFMASPSIKKQLQRKGRSKLEKLENLLPVDQAYENHVRHSLPWVIVYLFWKRAHAGYDSSAMTLVHPLCARFSAHGLFCLSITVEDCVLGRMVVLPPSPLAWKIYGFKNCL